MVGWRGGTPARLPADFRAAADRRNPQRRNSTGHLRSSARCNAVPPRLPGTGQPYNHALAMHWREPGCVRLEGVEWSVVWIARRSHEDVEGRTVIWLVDGGPRRSPASNWSGATVTVGPTGWRAVRASGEERRGIVHMADALTWALGGDVPVREVAPERAPKPRRTEPEGDWKRPVRGLLRHVSGGSVDLGGTSHSSAVATLRSGERRTFRDRADARVGGRQRCLQAGVRAGREEGVSKAAERLPRPSLTRSSGRWPCLASWQPSHAPDGEEST